MKAVREFKADVEVFVEVDGQLPGVLRKKRVSAKGSRRKLPALLRARGSLLETVGVAVSSGLVKRAPSRRGVPCRSSRLPAFVHVTVGPLVVGLAGHDAAAPLMFFFAAVVINSAVGARD